MTTVEALQAARALIERGWTKGELARDAAGKKVWPESPSAVCWCIDGALQKLEGSLIGEGLPFFYLTKATGELSLYRWNDAPERTQADVLVAFDRAIELAAREEK